MTQKAKKPKNSLKSSVTVYETSKNIHVLRCSKKNRKAHSRYVAAVCPQGQDLHLLELDHTNSSWSVVTVVPKKTSPLMGGFVFFVGPLIKERDCRNSLLKTVFANSVCFFNLKW